jgi:S1-C subfamily serine protease
VTATARPRDEHLKLGRVPRSRWRALAVVIIVLAVTALGSGIALARTTAPIGNGVVIVKTTLGYQRAAATGTGMVLTSSGKVLTNNHVIRGATRITVVVPGTSRSYTARVAGYAVTDDVAVLRLDSASNLATVKTSVSKVSVGDRVTAVGNGGGTGTLHSVTGSITTLRRSITVRDDARGAVRLSGVMGTSADVEPGDSGGPLLNSANAVIGMNTAGSSGYASRSGTQAYAIPIGKALSIVRQIDAGRGSTRIHIGATPFLGIQVASTLNGDFASPGAVVASVVRGGPAATAGVSPGDVITAIDGRAISSSSSIAAVILTKKPGGKVTIRLTDRSGAARSATVTLASGPAQ